ncbi:transcription termination factor MTEF18, mitochondrial-like [Rhodamnia argentea]|uniref:Transcription termination factor MTEF18, mitochondrial-like n=1 Tax=Rhodamnia argentea TaxID=178133 RepID=A0A8B8NTB0_9MYRT|nr:transcription termination factor MTEF18, mitochondrial-like [Rhodamnia argentea]XP_048138662.1 transcription termination factor MTEF18, mitochondrial-like [Rhodamnia argentea]XP_048138663.1 transcription termination factor MTEF18, mitochondrial-like [Rhodamnia argentea]
MRQLQKLGPSSILKWVSSNFLENRSPSLKIRYWPAGFVHGALNPRLYRTKRPVPAEELACIAESVNKIPVAVRKPAQAALSDYLHSTRGLQFLDADHISRNSPFFLGKLVKRIDVEGDVEGNVARLVSRFLRYHPINEFEPFFESMGLKPSEYAPFLPRDIMFLSDSDLLLENYHVLCNYGIERTKMGKIYREAAEIFHHDCGVLVAKIQAYEKLGLSQDTMAKLILCSPYILTGDVNLDFVEVIEKLKVLGFEFSWLKEQLSENGYYRWNRILEALLVLSKMAYTDEQLGRLISQHPGLLFEDSGSWMISLIGLLLKFGSTMDELHKMFLQFPHIKVEKFVSNLRQCFILFMEIDMEAEEIDRIVRSHPLLLGSLTLKKASSLLTNLNVGKKRLCEIIKENPQALKSWVIGLRVKPLANSVEAEIVHKTKFLLSLGFVEGSNDLKRALKLFRGKRGELQERFDCIVKSGLDRTDVCEMVRVSPKILSQTKDVLEMKIDILLNDLKYPLSSLVRFPAYLSFSIERVTTRIPMYNWLKKKGSVDPFLSLSTIVACSDKAFVELYVNRHPDGIRVWQDLRKTIIHE